MTEHKACPFNHPAGDHELEVCQRHENQHNTTFYMVVCFDCYATGPETHLGEAEAWRLWDERAGGVEPTESERRDD